MELNRRQTLGVFGIAAAAAALPASVAKAATSPVFGTIGLVVTSAGGLMAIVSCPVPVASVTARVFNQDRTVEIGQFTLALQPPTPATQGTWESPPLTGLPIGTYSVTYEATSADGGVTTATRGLNFWQKPVYTWAVSPATIDLDHRVVTVSGTVLGRHPATHVVTPIAGLPVNLRAIYSVDPPGVSTVTTAADGSFSGQLTLTNRASIFIGNSVDGSVNFVFSAALGPTEVFVSQHLTRMGSAIDATALNKGQSATVDGVLDALVAGQWQPLAARIVYVGFRPLGSDVGPTEWQETTTDGQGGFAVTVTPPIQGRYQVQFNGETFYFGDMELTENVLVRWPLSFDGERFQVGPTPSRLDDVRLFQVSGLLLSDSPLSVTSLTVDIQYRTHPGAPWQAVTSTVAESGGGGYQFSTTFMPLNSGEVRAVFAQTDLYQAATSPVRKVTVLRLPAVRPESATPAPHPLPPQRGL